jgi:hypothetical protein
MENTNNFNDILHDLKNESSDLENILPDTEMIKIENNDSETVDILESSGTISISVKSSDDVSNLETESYKKIDNNEHINEEIRENIVTREDLENFIYK